MKRLLASLLLAGCMVGCGSSSRSILYAGIESGLGPRVVISDSQARSTGEAAFAEWKSQLAVRAARTPHQSFSNLPPSVFLARLHATAARYGFSILAVHFFHPRQYAPYVRLQTRRYLKLARVIPAITRHLDPHRGTSDLTGYRFEGFYFEADDERGIPFVIVSNLTRGQVEGSQWARSDKLYPFPHG